MASIRRSAVVTVESSAISLRFDADSDSVNAGETVKLSWVAENADTCTASGSWEGERGARGVERFENMMDDAEYVLTCTDSFGESVSQTVTVTVVHPAPTVSLQADAVAVRAGETVKLTWNTENTETCVASGDWEGEKELSGEQEIGDVQADKKFTLTCSGRGGEEVAEAEILLNDTFVSIGADPMTVITGSSVTLKWDTENVTACTASGGWQGDVDAMGGERVIENLTEKTEFMIECADGDLKSTASVEVDVTAEPDDPGTIGGYCHNIESGQDMVPETFAHPWNVFSQAKEMLLQVRCNLLNATFEAGNGEPTSFIWHEVYYTKDGQTWQSGSLSSDTKFENNPNWIVGLGELTDIYDQDQFGMVNFVATYQCVFTEGAWRCGCRDMQNCSGDGMWNLQVFTMPQPQSDDDGVPDDPTGEPGDPTGGGDDGDDDGQDDGMAYCGDGAVNQDWEQCDGGDGCNEQCQDSAASSCNNIVLAKVTVTEAKNWNGGDASQDVYLGSVDRKLPSDTWFLVEKDGEQITDPDAVSGGYEDSPGVVVQRTKNGIRTILAGGHRKDNVASRLDTNSNSYQQPKEHVNGLIEFWGAGVKKLKSDNSGNNRLEGNWKNGDGKQKYNAGNDEVWETNGLVSYWLTVTTADDGFYVDYTPKDESICQ